MAFREKLAWLTLAAMLITYSIYFLLLAQLAAAGEPPLLRILTLFAAVTIPQAIIVAIAAIVLALSAKREAQARPDERDRGIARRGAAAAYYALMIGIIFAAVVMPFYAPRWHIITAALLALVLAETIRLGTVVLSYRRGWHG